MCQHVRVQISNSSASVVAMTAFVRHLPHVRPHLFLKTWCVYAREALVTFVCLLTSMQGGITCGAIDEPRKSSKAIDERVIINFRDKNVVIARFRDKNVYR